MKQPINFNTPITDTGGLPTIFFQRAWQELQAFRAIVLRPSDDQEPSANGELVIEATSNTTLTFKYQGTDGVVRSATLTLA